MYGRSSQAAADDACDSGGCGSTPVVGAIATQMTPVIPTPPSPISACPSNGLVNGGTLTPGDYSCTSLQIQGTVVIGGGGNGSGKVRIWVNGPFSVADGAIVNRQKPTPNLQIFEAAKPDGTAYSGSICGAEVWALLYTPGLSIDCNGSHQPTMYGAVVAQLHSGTGNHFDFHWDIQASQVNRDDSYKVQNWRECPAGASDC
jgi:hypothetical protein